jgi:predicted N-formylglutamate amidohydrolase
VKATTRHPGRTRWVLTCEHARSAIPRSYRALGLRREHILDHIGWDVGAHAVQRDIAGRLGAPWVASRWSRLLVDCNRAPEDATLIVPTSDGVVVPGNARVSDAERRRRLREYYEPYHAAVSTMIRRACSARADGAVRLLSLHSFTPVFGGAERRVEIGVLFDEHEALARRLGRALRRRGFRVRYNEPYSGRAGLIYSARKHGNAHGIEYVELEINNALIRTPAGQRRLGREIASSLVEV